MTGYDIAWKGLGDLEKAFVRAGVQADAAARENVRVAAMTLVRDAQNNFEGSHKKGQPHVGGSKPNIVTGNLRRSIMADSLRHTAMGGYTTSVGPTLKYGRRVELGLAPTGAYPYFGPAAAHLRTEMAAIATANWARFIKF
ncbi:HK97 gp10 family phage protein [Pseudarthrobacter sp. S9]|uniref:HK97 gp10 family phage protein n=1 Tax=Pseudarthrobacter sp. S9 TaxID=3418421 RepID=UPI003D03E59B